MGYSTWLKTLANKNPEALSTRCGNYLRGAQESHDCVWQGPMNCSPFLLGRRIRISSQLLSKKQVIPWGLPQGWTHVYNPQTTLIKWWDIWRKPETRIFCMLHLSTTPKAECPSLLFLLKKLHLVIYGYGQTCHFGYAGARDNRWSQAWKRSLLSEPSPAQSIK